MASMLARAAARFDGAFASLPAETRTAVALAMHRAAPAIQQYERDLSVLTRSEPMLEAFWDIALAVAFKLLKKGREGDWANEIAEMKAAAPATAEFLMNVGRLINGVLPGFVTPAIDVAAAPRLAEKSLPPPDAEIIKP